MGNEIVTKDIEKTINEYFRLNDRALEIVNLVDKIFSIYSRAALVQHNIISFHPEYNVQVEIRFRNESYCHFYYFPFKYFFMTDDEIKKCERERIEKENKEICLAKQEKEERELYEKLKAKYETK